MRGLLAAGTALFIMTSANAAEISVCIKMENDLDRLACYDKISGRTPLITPAKDVAGKWQLRTTTSKLTDDKNITLFLASEETVNCGWNRGDKIDLILRCQEKKTSMYFNTGCHMTSSDYNDYGDVTYRLDSDKARKVGMAESTDNKALGLWSGGKSIPVIKQMLGKDEMVVRMTPYGQSPFTATFKITGLSEAIEPLRKECNW